MPEAWFQHDTLVDNLYNPEHPLVRNSFAQKYGGHQFGAWNPDLGDGRGLLLGHTRDANQQPVDLHLKGAGPTPYSRFGDGRAVLRSTLREYLASEAMHHLGIPTSRALALITSNHPVQREQTEPGAMLIRTCPSHIRFGHFEYFAHSRQPELLERLFQYTFTHHCDQLTTGENAHHALLSDITQRTARLVAHWQSVGFVHGVMNTDNMSIHGITFDYGPYAFMDACEPGMISNHSDPNGRYAYDKQPGIALWNLNALAHGFTSYLDVDGITEALQQFEPTLQQHYAQLMANKLGLSKLHGDDFSLLNDLLTLMAREGADYTHTFRRLAGIEPHRASHEFCDRFVDRSAAQHWVSRYQQRLLNDPIDPTTRQATMGLANPVVVLRNHHAQTVIEAAYQGDFEPFQRLLATLQNPFDEQHSSAEFAQPPPTENANMKLSCSS